MGNSIWAILFTISKLNISKANLISWKESNYADENESFSQYKQYLKNFQVTNTVAEREIRLVADFNGKTHSEDKFQDSLLVVKKNRKEFVKNCPKSTFK